jgi:hypothetical protein
VRKWVATAAVAGLVLGLVMWGDLLLPGGPRIPFAAVAVLGLLVVPGMVWVLYTESFEPSRSFDGEVEASPPRRRRFGASVVTLAVAMPGWYQIALAALLCAVMANYISTTFGVVDHNDFRRGAVGVLVWFAAVPLRRQLPEAGQRLIVTLAHASVR